MILAMQMRMRLPVQHDNRYANENETSFKHDTRYANENETSS